MSSMLLNPFRHTDAVAPTVSLHDSTRANGTNVVNKPTTSVGDLILIVVAAYSTFAAPTCTGFTAGPASSTSGTKTSTLYRIADGSEGSTFTVGGGGFLNLSCSTWTNGAALAGVASTGAVNPAVCTGVTPTVDNGIFVSAVSCGANVAGIPAGYTAVTGNDAALRVSYKAYTTAAASGSLSSSMGDSTAWSGLVLAITSS